MKRIVLYLTVFLILASNSLLQADTFKNLTTGDSFIGFRTTKQASGKTLVFCEDENQFSPLDLSEYEVTFDAKGRRDSIMIVSITQPEILLSEVVSQMISDMIFKAADTGSQAVLIQIDSPGGNGIYMRNITQAIVSVRERTGCPVAAYLSGGKSGGAFSAAAVIALACDKIYMSPNAAIGAVGPITTAAMNNNEYLNNINMYAPDSLATYSIYASSLASSQNRPPVLAKAMVDKSTIVVEVRDLTGKTEVVEQSQRTNDQTVIRVISEGIAGGSLGNAPDAIQGFSKLLNLTATDAVRLGLADKVVNTYPEILADLGLNDVQTVRAPDAEKMIRKFNASKRNINQLLMAINENEERISVLESQISTMEEMIRTGVRLRQKNKSNYPVNNDQYNERSGQTTQRNSTNRTVTNSVVRGGNRRIIGTDSNINPYQTESITTEEPVGNIQQVQYELMRLLNDTIPMYRRIIGIGRRWPGALPATVSIQSLQAKLDSSLVMLNNVQRYLSMIQQR